MYLTHASVYVLQLQYIYRCSCVVQNRHSAPDTFRSQVVQTLALHALVHVCSAVAAGVPTTVGPIRLGTIGVLRARVVRPSSCSTMSF